MIPQLNIITMINSVAILSDSTFNNYLYMVDNSRGQRTCGQGTDSLCTQVVGGQVLNWHLNPINIQMAVEFGDFRWYKDGILITNPDDEPVEKSKLYGSPTTTYWAAIVKSGIKGQYEYQFQVNLLGKMLWMTSFPRIYVA
ncbi:MAG: hypothetical protein MJK04_11885 [Psychrosphaera sp.]|nr:hypothetical protein [Psychrosphaera sp.]